MVSNRATRHICHLLSVMNNKNFASYADDKTTYIRCEVIQVIEYLKEASNELLSWFANEQIKTNPGKCHLMTRSSDEMSRCVENYNKTSSNCEKL